MDNLQPMGDTVECGSDPFHFLGINWIFMSRRGVSILLNLFEILQMFQN
jgi:hypothetical protein